MEAGADSAEDRLLRLPWLCVSIGGSCLLAKSRFGEASYRLLLTDLQCVWEEKMEATAIQRRALELNKRLRAPVQAFFSHLCEAIQPFLSGGRADAGAQISLTKEEDDSITMRLKSELAGLPFHWAFHCSPAPVSLVCAQLVRPLLVMSRLLQRQAEELGALLVRKDAEIQDYRDNGAALSRERLQTDAFEEQTYREDFLAKALPLLGSEGRHALDFTSDLRQLYAAVVARTNTRKRKLCPEASVEEEERAGTAASSPSAADSASDKPAVQKQSAGGAEPEKGSGQSAGGAEPEKRAGQSAGGAEPEKRRGQSAGGAEPGQQSQSVTAEFAKPKKKKVGLFR